MRGLRGGLRLQRLAQLRLQHHLQCVREVGRQLLVPGGAARLAGERAQARFHLADQHPDVAQVVARLHQAALRERELVAEAADVRRLLDQLAPVGRAQREHLVHQALRHVCVGVLADLCPAEQIQHVRQAYLLVVDQVLVLAGAVCAARHGHLGELDRHPAVRVVQVQRDLRQAHLPALVGAGEDHVLRLAGTDLLRRLFAERPAQRVGHVGLAGAVRPRDDGHARPELEPLPVRERLEAVNLESPQVHLCPAFRSLPAVGSVVLCVHVAAEARAKDG